MDSKVKGFLNTRKSKIVYSTIIMLLFFMLHAMIFHFHEAWRDESQAWVLVRNSSLKEIVGLCASEGHPVLWFFILFPFTRLGFSFFYFSYISITLMSIAVWVWMYRAPFSLLTKLCVVLSPVFFYYNPIICRIYAVLVLLFVLIASIWESRFAHPVWYGVLTALLIQSHVLVIGVALGLLLDMLFDLKSELSKGRTISTARLAGLIIPIISLVCFYLELRQHNGGEYFIRVSLGSLLKNLTVSNIMHGLASVAGKFGKWKGLILLVELFAISFSLVLESLRKKSIKLYISEITVLIFGFCGYWGIIILVRRADHIQMAIVFWMIVLFCCWIYKVNHRIRTAFQYMDWALVIVCASAVLICVYKDVMFDIQKPFSGSREIVEQVIEAVPEQSVIILKNNACSTSPYSYLTDSQKRFYFWDIDNAEEYSVHIWGKANQRTIGIHEVPEYAAQDFEKDARKLYFISSEKMDAEYDNALICMNTTSNKWDENYWVYDLGLIKAVNDI